ncbi:MAG: DUF3460 family protein [Azoarcus sp.]|jgi:hypothetical protein|nr:DUF3460 family protein [Azoarcus sp.]
MPRPYYSEYTRFMREWLQQHPEEREVQRTGLALWGDRPRDREARRAFDAARVPRRRYYYDSFH